MHKTITIFGASGAVGRIVVKEALFRGYSVKAFVHNHSNLETHPRLVIVQGDIHDHQDVEQAIVGSQAVISTLGSWHTKQKDVVSVGVSHIIPAMQKAGIDRVVTLTGADARASGDDLSLIHRLSYPFISLFAGSILRDGEKHIALLEKSGLDWTVIRSPIMNSHHTSIYSLSSKRPYPWHFVSRLAVANALLNQLEAEHTPQQALYIS